MHRKPPMTEAEARENVARMICETNPRARRLVLRVALGPHGNLSDGAKAVYRGALAALARHDMRNQ